MSVILYELFTDNLPKQNFLLDLMEFVFQGSTVKKYLNRKKNIETFVKLHQEHGGDKINIWVHFEF